MFVIFLGDLLLVLSQGKPKDKPVILVVLDFELNPMGLSQNGFVPKLAVFLLVSLSTSKNKRHPQGFPAFSGRGTPPMASRGSRCVKARAFDFLSGFP